jgi:hypothetical protein
MANSLRIDTTNDETIILIESQMNTILAILFGFFPLITLAATIGGVVQIAAGSNHVGLFVLTAIMPFATIRLIRLWLWNTSGSEEITITNSEVRVVYDYRFWKDRRQYDLEHESTWSFEPSMQGKSLSRGHIHIYGMPEEFHSVMIVSESNYLAQMQKTAPASMDGIIGSQLPSSSDI